MLHRSLDTFVTHDSEAARKIAAEDDEVDNLYDQIFRELISFMVEDPRTITRATRLGGITADIDQCSEPSWCGTFTLVTPTTKRTSRCCLIGSWDPLIATTTT